jgi:hypothetical protein
MSGVPRFGASFSMGAVFVYRESGVSGLGGGGETISIYLGVSIKTRDMRKNAKRVFLSISYLTGSSPPSNRGLHLNILAGIRPRASKRGFVLRASMA